ncbi:MAG TPA: hypothetical protein VLU99_08270 [Nitrososphaerales archaeon]|nr:hypothetical protein [Nitrososphaerales archaeon]
MRPQPVLGLVLVFVGLALLYVLRGVFFSLVLLVLGFLGVLLALVLIAGGLAMIFWSRRRW